MKLKLYYVYGAHETGYDTYDSAVVAAKSPEDALTISPSEWIKYTNYFSKVDYLGSAKRGTKRGVICASFNAG